MTAVLPGDLLFCRSTGPVGELIRFGQDTRYHGWRAAIRHAVTRPERPESDPCWGNHIAVCAGGSLIEALSKGLTRSPLTRYGVTNSIVLPLAQVCPAVTDLERVRAAAFAERALQMHYDYGWFGFASIVGQLTTPERFDISWNGAMVCSAFGARVWEHAGVTLPTRSPYTTMPADLRAMTL